MLVSARPIACWRFDEADGATTLESASGKSNAISYVFNIAKYKPSTDPVRRAGIAGNGLLFDGYSTWVTHKLDDFDTPQKALTIAAWVAPRTFEDGIGGQLSAIVNQHDRLAEQGFILGTYSHGAWSLQVGVGHAWLEIWSEEARLPRHQWAFVVATFDSHAGVMRLYLDGEAVAQQSFRPGLQIQPAAKDVLIGKHNKAMRFAGAFEANMFNGIIDELQIYDIAWTAAEVKAAYLDYLRPHDGQKPAADTRPRRSFYDGDKYRPQYHFLPPHHWMNEPHALLHFKGKYHITYQHNAHGPFWHNITWGHAVSDDLLRWEDLPDAIITEKDTVAPSGIWSGSATLDADDNPVFFFTAGNYAMSPNQMTGLARSTYAQDGDLKLRNWIVHDKPVTVLDRDIEICGNKLMPQEFRDPFVWREQDFWCQIVGAGVQNIGGAALLYTSTDLENWQYQGPLLVGDQERYPLNSMMWELPVFLPLGGGKHIFLFSPWWSPGQMSSHFLKYVPYHIGVWDVDTLTFTPDDEKPQIFDYGEHFTGPSGTVDEQGRAIVLNIAQMKRDPQISYDSGWDGNAGLPIVLFTHEDGQLGLKPIPELESLRGEHLIDLADVTIDDANRRLRDVHGKMLEIQLRVRVPDGACCGVSFFRSGDGTEETTIYYDSRHRTFNIDRDRSSLNATVHQRGIQGGPLDLPDGCLWLRVYLDHSMIEAYANELKSITSRVYPARDDSNGLRLRSTDHNLQIEKLDVWQMHSAYNLADMGAPHQTRLPR